ASRGDAGHRRLTVMSRPASGTVVPGAYCGRFHHHAHLRVTHSASAGSYRPSGTGPRDARGPIAGQPRRPAEEMTVKLMHTRTLRAWWGTGRPGRRARRCAFGAA